MFSIEHKQTNYGQVYRLHNTKTQEYAEIFPACGGILNALVLQMPQGLYNVIDGFTNQAEFNVNNSSSFKSNILFPFPNRIRHGAYTFEQTSYTLPINFAAEQNAIHGLIYDKKFTICKTHEDNSHAALELTYSYMGDIAGFPFPFVISVTYTLSEYGLSLYTECTNTGTTAFPFGFGWHHYFRISDTLAHTALQVPTTELLEVDAAMIPTGKLQPYKTFSLLQALNSTQLDTCFAVEQNKAIHIQLVDTETSNSIAIRYHATDFPYVQIYTPPHGTSIAIEPMTCAPNAFNNGLGLRIAEPQKTYTFECEIINSRYKGLEV